MNDETDFQNPDESEPASERQAELRAAYEANTAAGSPPFQRVAIGTRGELQWIMRERNWSGKADAGDKPRADLREAWLSDVNLAGMRLRGANLLEAKLWGANLSGADLEDANLTDAELGDANLTGANLRHANLSGVGFLDTNLRGANLEGANLLGKEMWRADLTGANLRTARMSIGMRLRRVVPYWHGMGRLILDVYIGCAGFVFSLEILGSLYDLHGGTFSWAYRVTDTIELGIGLEGVMTGLIVLMLIAFAIHHRRDAARRGREEAHATARRPL